MNPRKGMKEKTWPKLVEHACLTTPGLLLSSKLQRTVRSSSNSCLRASKANCASVVGNSPCFKLRIVASTERMRALAHSRRSSDAPESVNASSMIYDRLVAGCAVGQRQAEISSAFEF